MVTLESRYLPSDRFRSLADGSGLPTTADGSVLFADISGFTPITERLRAVLGVRRGAETLAVYLNRVYDALIARVDAHGGSIISFAGDAITCWFAGENAALVAVDCAFALLDALHDVERIEVPGGESALLGLKVAVSSGSVRRFVVGAPQQIDVLAGATVARTGAGESIAERSEVLADARTVERLATWARVQAWRDADGERFAVLERPDALSFVPPAPLPLENAPPAGELRHWMLPAVADYLQAGLGEYVTELRPATALFVRFAGIRYDDDPDAERKLDRFVGMIQGVVARYEGSVLQLTIGDKGSYIYAAFGAPFTHEDDAARALNAALDIRAEVRTLDYLEPVRIGVSAGMMRTGAYGGETRRTYGVLGDEVNLAARLMMLASPDDIFVSESVIGAHADGFVLNPVAPVQVKGKVNPVRLFRLIERRERSFAERFYTTPLVGREGELAAIQAAMQPSLEGRHAGIITVYGDPGMGKSRLAFEVQRRLRVDVTWLTGQADALNRAPLNAFVYFLRPYFGQRREQDARAFDATFDELVALADEQTRADLNTYRSFMAGLVGVIFPGSPFESANERLRIDNGIAAIKAFARAEGSRQPLVLHLEDAHWLDESSIRALQELTYNMNSVPLTLILTSRYNDDGSPMTIPGVYSVPVHAVNLKELSADGVRSVAGAILGARVSDHLAAFIHERGEGNPFFTEQLALDLKERDALETVDGQFDLRADTAAEVPSGINAILIARLDRLAAQVKAVVQTAAVLGREFDVQVLSKMLREGERAHIQVAEQEAIWTAIDALRYLFRHALLRDAAYDMQVRERLQSLHRLAAETIEALYPDDHSQYDALLEHWNEAGVVDKSLYYTIPVCERLVGIAADYGRAERLLAQALAYGVAAQRMTLLRLLGDAALSRGEYLTAITHYEACLAAGDDEIEARILALDGLGKVHTQQGDYPTAVRFAEQALTLARDQGNQAGTARALTTLGDAAFQQGDYPTAHTHFSEGLRLFRELASPAGVVGALNRLGKIATLKGDKTTARTYLEESLNLARQMGDRQQLGSILNNLGNLSLDQGDSQATRAYYESSLRLRREIGDRNGVGGSLGNLAILMLRQGKTDEGLAFTEASLNERRAIGDRKGIANALALLASIAYDRNDLLSAQRYLEEGLETQRAINDRWGIATNLTNLGEIARMRGDFAAAGTYVAEGLALYRQLEQPKDIADALTTQAWLAQVQDDAATARQLYEEALAMRREINDQRGIARCLLDLSSLDASLGLYADAERRLSEGIEIMRAIGDKNLAPSLAALATIKRRLGQPPEVVHPLMRAALTQVQVAGAPKMKLATVIEAAQLLYEDGRYPDSAELSGFIGAQSTSSDAGKTLNRLLDDLRAHLDTAALTAALERGKTLVMDDVIARLQAAFDQG